MCILFWTDESGIKRSRGGVKARDRERGEPAMGERRGDVWGIGEVKHSSKLASGGSSGVL